MRPQWLSFICAGLATVPLLTQDATITRSHPLCRSRVAGGPPFLLFCLAPYGVCRASVLAFGAVGSYPAFSPFPHLAMRWFVFCDTFRDRDFRQRPPTACAWHTALWCPDFPLPAFRFRRTNKRQPPADPSPTIEPLSEKVNCFGKFFSQPEPRLHKRSAPLAACGVRLALFFPCCLSAELL